MFLQKYLNITNVLCKKKLKIRFLILFFLIQNIDLKDYILFKTDELF